MRGFLILLACVCALSCSGSDRRTLLISKKGSSGGVPSIDFRSFSTNNYNGTTATFDTPAGTVAGDLLLASLCSDSAHNVTTPPTGWTQLTNNTVAQSGYSSYWKIADGTEGSTITFTFDASESGAGIMANYTNAVSVDLAGLSSDAPGAGVAHTTAAILPSVNNCMLAAILYCDPTASPTFTAVSGYTLRATAVRTAAGVLALVDKRQGTRTSEGLQVIEDAGGTWGGHTIALR